MLLERGIAPVRYKQDIEKDEDFPRLFRLLDFQFFINYAQYTDNKRTIPNWLLLLKP